MLTSPFLTDIDPRRAVKVSRDPLGVMAIPTHFGRCVVRNLTTVSTSARDFTVSALGFTLPSRASALLEKDRPRAPLALDLPSDAHDLSNTDDPRYYLGLEVTDSWGTADLGELSHGTVDLGGSSLRTVLGHRFGLPRPQGDWTSWP